MKILLDTCISGILKTALTLAGRDVVWAGEWTTDPGDDEILALAFTDHRILVTLDKDFGELAVVRGRPHVGIVRLVALTAAQQVEGFTGILASHGDILQSGAIVTIEHGRVRVRPPDQPGS